LLQQRHLHISAWNCLKLLDFAFQAHYESNYNDDAFQPDRILGLFEVTGIFLSKTQINEADLAETGDNLIGQRISATG
jgi:hypothetical protein